MHPFEPRRTVVALCFRLCDGIAERGYLGIEQLDRLRRNGVDAREARVTFAKLLIEMLQALRELGEAGRFEHAMRIRGVVVDRTPREQHLLFDAMATALIRLQASGFVDHPSEV